MLGMPTPTEGAASKQVTALAAKGNNRKTLAKKIRASAI